MPEFLTPGVFIEEIERGPHSIAGVPTSTAAFLGETERGPLRPKLVTSYADYCRWFGEPFRDACYLPYAAAGFFENGGKRLYVCRIVGGGASTASKRFGDFRVSAVGPGAWGRRVWVKFENGSTADRQGANGFRLRLAFWSSDPADFQLYDPFDPSNSNEVPRPQHMEDYDDLSIDPSSPDYFGKRLFDSRTNEPVSALARVDCRDSETMTKPRVSAAAGEFLDTDGADDANALGSEDFDGGLANGRVHLQGLQQLALAALREVALVYAPYPSNEAVAINRKIIAHCELQRFRFAVVDTAQNDAPADLDPRRSIADTQYSATYAPWIHVSDPRSGTRLVVPPGGHVLGVYARTDIEQGVFKAPANAIARGALDVRFDIDDQTQGVMTLRGVNAIRRFSGRGIRVWSARTLSSDGLWKYVPVRRLLIFLENSLYQGTRWVVFDPNDDRLWARVSDTIRLFLRTQWRNGALLGRTEGEAFFINCDRTTMTQDDILNGRLICEIGVAPVRPAEFVIFRIFQNTAEAQR
jgi:uncharacterized protein